MLLPQLQQDKANHVIYGVVIFAIVASLSGPVMGLAVATAIGALKELVVDWLLAKGKFELLDFLATTSGGLLGYFCAML